MRILELTDEALAALTDHERVAVEELWEAQERLRTAAIAAEQPVGDLFKVTTARTAEEQRAAAASQYEQKSVPWTPTRPGT